MEVKINENCIGCGACLSFAPEVFEMGAGTAVVKDGADLEANKEATISAANACPAQSIIVTE